MQSTRVVDQPRERLIVALDVSTVDEAMHYIKMLGDSVLFYKIGLELFSCNGGLELAERVVDFGGRVFFDLKFHDIPNTVERATKQIARLGGAFLTIHAYPQTMRAALAGAANSDLKLLGVSVLTSADDNDLLEAGYSVDVRTLVSRRAAQAEQIGLFGFVTSAAEVSILRAEGRDLALVCPGIRTSGNEFGDQKRVSTPSIALRNGADYLVIGRPILRSADPRRAVDAIISEIEASIAVAGNIGTV
jgi:orotidine-5'-phosphate decarboxylase